METYCNVSMAIDVQNLHDLTLTTIEALVDEPDYLGLIFF